MYRDFRVEVFIPAGRKRTMSLLMDNLFSNKDIVDKVQVWLNTDVDQKEDYEWLQTLPDIYGDWVELVERRTDRQPQSPKQLNTGGFYTHTIDESTIYFRFDDDIIFVDDNYFKNILDFRIDNPDYFLVFGLIINNAITSFWLQQEGKISRDYGVVESDYCMDNIGWNNANFGYGLHREFIRHLESNTISELYLSSPKELDRKRFSVSNFCFFGRDFAKFGGELNGAEEESWLTEEYPKQTGVVNVICPNAICVHYSFFTQRKYLDEMGLLDVYKEIVKQKLSDNYYKLLGHETSNSDNPS